MRLDHLLSRERAKGEIPRFIPRSTHRKLCEEKEKKSNRTKVGRMTVNLLEAVSFSGIERFLFNRPCLQRGEGRERTLKTAQPDGKHLVKKPVAKKKRGFVRSMKRDFASWSQERIKVENFDSYSIIVTIKLLRAQGGCHGTGRRRKTW